MTKHAESLTVDTIEDDPRWARMARRDPSADGEFWYSVSSTGVYCLPSCPSRLARPDHVRFHDTLEGARASGCRPCKRCRPEDPPAATVNAGLVAKACRLIEASEAELSLQALADAVGRSPAQLHRLFKRATGLTPKQYARECRAAKVRQGLAAGDSVTTTLYAAGFNSSGRFYAKSTEMLGMKPSQYRAGGANEELRFAIAQTSLGALLVASSGKGVACILLGDDPAALLRELQDRFPRAGLVGADGDYESLVAQVVGFVEAPGLGLDLPLDVRGTAFQQRVWQALRAIPLGSTASYTDIARRIGAPQAVRAVAGACAANPLAVAVPCHRVLRSDGSLSGYAWGVERKRALLEREAKAAERKREPDRAQGPKREAGLRQEQQPESRPGREAELRQDQQSESSPGWEAGLRQDQQSESSPGWEAGLRREQEPMQSQGRQAGLRQEQEPEQSQGQEAESR